MTDEAALLSAWIAPDGTAYFAGGVLGGGTGLLLRYREGQVTTVPTPGAHTFWWIHGLSDTEMFLAGEGGELHRFDGMTVTRLPAEAPSDAILFGVWGTSADDLWSVGGSFAAGGPRRIVLRSTAGVEAPWTAVPSPDDVDPETTYFKVWGSGGRVWIVGDRGVVLEDAGAGLLRVDAPGAERYVTVHGCGAGDAYAVGGGGSGAVIHWDGGAWTSLAIGATPPLSGVACTPSDGGRQRGAGALVGGAFGFVGRLAPNRPAEPIETPAEVQDLTIHAVALSRDGRRVVAVGGDLFALTAETQKGFALEIRP